MPTQHPLGRPLPLRTLPWLRQLQVCQKFPAMPTTCMLQYMYVEPVIHLFDVKTPAGGCPVTVVHPAMLMLPTYLCR